MGWIKAAAPIAFIAAVAIFAAWFSVRPGPSVEERLKAHEQALGLVIGYLGALQEAKILPPGDKIKKDKKGAVISR